ncbi:MAG: hypothetical protein ACI3ZN_10430 [Candidatus Cryptobacteroides sp.]
METGSLRKGNAGFNNYEGYFFSEDNTQTIRIFETLGIKHLRVGGGSVDANKIEPEYADIDHLFAFARKVGVKVVYSFKLLNGSSAKNTELAQYIQNKYSDVLDCFAIGNEPDWDSYHKTDPEIKDYPTYRDKWLRFANEIRASVPDAKFTGPNTGSNYPVTGAKNTDYNGKSWTVNFAQDLKSKALLKMASTHNYVGQDAVGQQLTPTQMVNKMLSKNWINKEYPALYHSISRPVIDSGFPYRLAESNSFSGGCEGGSNCFATALFALDYLHWWAEHQCAGVNFHNKQWVLNAPIGMNPETGDLFVNPVGYGIAAFSQGGKGFVQPMEVINKNQINATAYAVRDGNTVYVTLINKEYGSKAKELVADIDIDNETSTVETLLLESPEHDPLSLKATLGGTEIKSTDKWEGKWEKADEMRFVCKPASALIIKIQII